MSLLEHPASELTKHGSLKRGRLTLRRPFSFPRPGKLVGIGALTMSLLFLAYAVDTLAHRLGAW